MGSLSDPIADLLTQIRNALNAEHRFIDIRWSNAKEAVVKILKEQGFIAQFLVKEDRKKKTMRIFLKYGKGREKVLTNLKRESRPSLRKYVSYKDIPRIYGGMGIAIISTSKGVVDGSYAHENKLGGELLCTAW